MEMSQNNTGPLQQTIIDELGLGELPEERKTALLGQITESLLKRILVRVLSDLSEADRDTFAAVQETGDPEKINTFLTEKIPNYEAMLQEIIAEFKTEMKDTVSALS